ncbi:MAG: hypothetical protein RL839_04760 [Gammaproteobacteria bacterium]
MKKYLISIGAFIVCSPTLGLAQEVNSAFGIDLGKPYTLSEIELPPLAGRPYPASTIQVPMPSDLQHVFLDVRVGISLLSNNVFQLSAERAFSGREACYDVRRGLQEYLENEYDTKAKLNEQFQFSSNDGVKWVQFSCGQRTDSGYWTLSFTATDESESEKFREWLTNQ